MQNGNGSSTERDLVLSPNTHAFILNQQKGNVEVYVGPHKSMVDASSDQPVRWSMDNKRFVECKVQEAIQNNMIAPEGWYLTLKNPAKDDKHPTEGSNGNIDLNVGRKVNIQGPVDFALWPGQMCKVIQGHHLRSNQYVLVRVYDEESAKENWNKSVINTVNPDDKKNDTNNVTTVKEDDISMGKLFIIKGTDVSFYIPPTGVEVLQYNGTYVQEAVTLERLEYCVLLDEDGNKEYVRGPAVVFPKPTQIFIEKDNKRKYKAVTLNDITGLYVSVVKDYEDGTKHKAGDELFITGKDNSIYYPREEHAIIKYGGQEKHHAVAVTAGEGLYVMNRDTSEIPTVEGPRMILPDPRNSVIIKRVLTDVQAEQWFPGNNEAKTYNKNLRNIQEEEQTDGYLTREDTINYSNDLLGGERGMSDGMMFAPSAGTSFAKSVRHTSSKSMAGDSINRGTTFTKPRTLCLDSSKYDGAVRIQIWGGYGICIYSKSNERKVVVGPKSILLGYNEELVSMDLSKGTPKSTYNKIKTPYLRVLNNRIKDGIKVVTKDMVNIQLELSYMVNFDEKQKDKWFGVENYVQFLCERMRSIILRMVKQYGIEEFHQNYIDLIRNLVLNKKEIKTEQDKLTTGRWGSGEGRYFEENGMYISDVEITSLHFQDHNMQKMLNDSQTKSVIQSLEISDNKKDLELVEEKNRITQLINKKESETMIKELDIEIEEKSKQLEVMIKDTENNLTIREIENEDEVKRQTLLATIHKAKLEMTRCTHDEDQEHKKALLEIDAGKLINESKAFCERFKAFTPQLVQAMQALGDKNLISDVSKNLSVHTILGDKNISDVLKSALSGTSLGNNFEQLISGYSKVKDVIGKD
jgi:major vault protein